MEAEGQGVRQGSLKKRDATVGQELPIGTGWWEKEGWESVRQRGL